LWKQTLEGGGTKAEADKCRLHPKNVSVAQSMNVSKNYKKKTVEFVHIRRETGVPVTSKTIK
jgi:hypothetical protein